ncbi:hypothetical protein [Streptomyces sp. NBC_00582]|uniref:hypothetical protein n=1 Tax=Streptomyces sp. NBC_00582 TaxID=2975783 RepID=UPI0010640D52|nr:hypothetical protein [Streptomyces sp. NBC_00582]WUB59314.1 S1 family peptidase [Streptomyces sp. NBC_00582]
MRSIRLARWVTGAAVVAATLGAPASSWAADEPATASVKEPSQAQWKQLDAVHKKHSSLGVFDAKDGSGPLLTLPAGTSAAEKDKVLADIPAGMKVKVKVSRFHKGETDKIADEVGSGKWNKDARKYGLGAAYDADTDKVMVNTDAPESVTASLKSQYGDKIEVFRSRFEEQLGRYNDSAPFWGGDSIHTASWGNCTSGFKVHVVDPETGQATDMMTTAGHCYSLNERVLGADGKWMGWVKRFGPADLEAFVGYTYDPFIWTGGTPGSTSNLPVHSLSGMYYGMHVCVSGQTTFNHCGHPVTATNYGFNWTDHSGHTHWNSTTWGFVFGPGGTNYPRYDNGKLTEAGDSGAPVYVAGSSTAAAAGTLSGIVEWKCDPCTNGTQWRMYGVKAQFIYDSWHGSISMN